MQPRPTTITRPSVSFASDLGAYGDRQAVLTPDEAISYRRLSERVDIAAAALGDERRLLLITASNDLESLVWYLAALRSGNPAILADSDNPRQHTALLAAYDPDVVVSAGGSGWDLVERRTESVHNLHPDLALLLSTSGSTGSPKLVRLSRQNLQANAESIAEFLELHDDDRAATSLPMHYCYGLSVVNSHLLRGAGLILTRLSVADRCFWTMLREHRGTSFAGVPYTFDLLDRVGFSSMQLPDLRYITQAGGRLAPEKVQRYANLGERDGWKLFVMYGQTEATARMAFLPPDLAASHPSSIGVAIPGGSFTLEPSDATADPDEGELVYRGPNVMLGYAEGQADLAKGRVIDALHTGDLARINDAGLFELVGRKSRFLKLFGLRIDLQEVERLLEANAIAASCTGNDERLIVAVTHDTDGAHATRVIHEHVGIPTTSIQICELDVLPRLANGKADYVEVRRQACLQAEPAGSRHDSDRTDDPTPAAGIRELFTTLFGHTDFTDQSTFVTLGGDSMSYVEMSIGIERALGYLPADWHTTPIRVLESTKTQRRRFSQMDTTVVLRALAIVLVAARHVKLLELAGGAHLLLAVSGHNFARFQLSAVRHSGRARSMLGGIARIAIPSIAWIGVLVATTDDYGFANLFLANNIVGSGTWDERWRFWFIEGLIQVLVVCAIAFAIPGVRRFERSNGYRFACLVLLVALAARFNALGLTESVRGNYKTLVIAWLFALGWLVQRSSTRAQRWLTSAAILVCVPGFFDDPTRDKVVAGGLLLLLWTPRLSVPRVFHRAVGVLAVASLYIYLTHFQIYHSMPERLPPLIVFAAVLAGGIIAWAVTERTAKYLKAGMRRVTQPSRASADLLERSV